MHNVLLVIRHEITKTVSRPSFWLTAFVFPLIIFAFTFGSQLLAQGMLDSDGEVDILPGILGEARETEPRPIGYVDLARVITQLPEGFPSEAVVPFADRAAADVALADGHVNQYYVVPTDFIKTGELQLIQARFSPLQQLGTSPFEYILTYNLVEDANVAARLLNPMARIERQSVSVPDEAVPEAARDLAVAIVPTAMLFIFFFVLTMSSGFVLKSVSSEKENRVVEILLLSLRPRELMLGKIVGLGAVALLQMAVWMGAGLLVLGQGLPVAGLAAMPLSGLLPPGFIVWVVLYFLFGYLTFASLLGALGTLAPNMREGSQFTFVVLLPLMIPLWLNYAFVEAPNGPLVTVLSLFPLTSPVSMVARLAATSVPLWQVLGSLLLLGATTYGFVLLSARFFRSDTLLSGESLSVRRIARELRRSIV